MTIIFLTLFLILLPFTPIWSGQYEPQTNRWGIYHVRLWEYIKGKLIGAPVTFLTYSQVCEMYDKRIKD